MLHSRICVLFILCTIAGCVAKEPAPVVDKSRQSDYAYVENESACQAQTVEEFCHIVERGDTLYAISRRYGLKVVEIASRNAIKAPYIIRPGELLVVRQGGEPVSAASPSQVVQTTEETPAVPLRETTVLTPPKTRAKPTTASDSVKSTTSRPSNSSRSSPSSERVAITPLAPVKMTLRTTRTKSGWQWPVPYEPIVSDGEKGLEYRLADDTEIVAAIGGKVIYAGAGLNKFRHLIIVDSATAHLVAYEFNTAHVISEGQSISRGETITRITPAVEEGATDTERYRHFRFEIWANGKPLNPNSVIAVASRN